MQWHAWQIRWVQVCQKLLLFFGGQVIFEPISGVMAQVRLVSFFFRKRLTRNRLRDFMSTQPPGLVVFDVFGGADARFPAPIALKCGIF